MKKFAVICLLMASLHARADVTLVEHVQSDAQGPGGQGQDVTFKIKGGKVRLDLANGQMSAIMDTGTGDTIALIHMMKKFVSLSGDKIKALIAQAKQRRGNADAAAAGADAPKLVDTGKQEKVGDYNAEIYTLETPRAKTTLWVSKDVPDSATIQQVMKNVIATVQKLGADKVPDISGIDGVAVKTQTVANGTTTTMSLVSVKQDPIADADLQVPADYTEMDPSLMGAGMLRAEPPQEPPAQPEGDSSAQQPPQ